MTDRPTEDTDQSATYKPPFVVDAVLHAFNLLPSNARNPRVRDSGRGIYSLLAMTGDGDKITPEDFVRDWSIEELADMVFAQSEVDVGVYHGIPWFDYFYDGFSPNEKGIEMRRRWPNRVMFYGSVDPLQPGAADKARELIVEHGACGIKFYPENWHHKERTVDAVELDAPTTEPVLQVALEFGVPVAIHKAIPAGQGRWDNYRLTDVEGAALRYPDLQIEVVHSGFAFLEDTRNLMMMYPNVWANLEVTAGLAISAKTRFAHALGSMLASGAASRIIFASGAIQLHPQTLLEALYTFQIPEEVSDGYGIPPITKEQRDGILGLNFARLHKLDTAAVLDSIKDDEFSRKKEHGLLPRWEFPAPAAELATAQASR